jgi:hypothetical protein
MPLIECLLCGEFLSNYDGKGNMTEVENGMMKAEDHIREVHSVTNNITFFRNIHFLPEEERSKMLLKGVIIDHDSLATRLKSPRDNEFNGPFPDPLTLMSNGRSFDQHTQYTHKDETQCKNEIEPQSEHSEDKIAGPATDSKKGGLIYTCNRKGCKILCPCKICKNGFCTPKCNTERNCFHCIQQCKKHRIGLMRSYDEKTQAKSTFRNKTTIFPNINVNECEICKSDLADHEKNHMIIHTRCKFCKHTEETLSNTLTLHDVRKHEINTRMYEEFICKYCFKKLKTKNNRLFHEDRCVKCVHCQKKFDTNCETDEHEKACKENTSKKQNHDRFEDKSQSEDESAPKKPKLEITCEICDKTFSGLMAKGNLARHIKSKHTEERFKCNICDSNFTRKDKLKEHKENVHNFTDVNYDYYYKDYPRSQPYMCAICDAKFERKDKLDRHTTTVHSNDLFNCPSCEKSFKTKWYMKKHASDCGSDK